MIGKRGINIDTAKLEQLRIDVDLALNETLADLSDTWHENLVLGKTSKKNKDAINIRSSKQLPLLLKKKGFKIPTVPPTKSQRDAGNSDYRESVGKLPLQLLYSKTSDPALKKLLTIAELMTLKSRYINARLYQTQDTDKLTLYLASYNVAGTLTGRRSSNKNIFGYGGNAQNFPKHTKSAEKFLSCLVPRPGNIFLFVDQKSAEEWPVSALCYNKAALTELEHGVDRHTNLAAFIFAKPVSAIGKKSMDRYLGKKSRHANNYGMQAKRMSLSLAQEGFFIGEQECKVLLDKVDKYDPSVKQVFHKTIRDQISKTRFLKTPFGRERYFMGFRPGASNNDVFGEAFAYIPQSVVGDNTGFAVLYLEEHPVKDSIVVQEGHDSIVQDVLKDEDTLWTALQNTTKSFDREVVFANGFKFKIPVEAEVGYSFNKTVSLDDISKESLMKALGKLGERQ
jgi:DNA polymerase I-like protein with 3'-5' exonuclease and polymerase domains